MAKVDGYVVKEAFFEFRNNIECDLQIFDSYSNINYIVYLGMGDILG